MLIRLFYVCFCFCFIGAAYAVPTPPRKAEVSAAGLAKVEAAAQKATRQKQEFEQQAKKVKNDLNSINQKMIAAAKQIQNGEDEVRQQREALDKLQEHLRESEAKFDAERDMLIETLSALQNLALRPSEAVLVQPLSPVEVMRSSILLRGSIHALKGRADIIRESIEDIANQKNEIATRLIDLEAKNTKLAAQQEELKKMMEQKSKLYGQLSAQSKDAEEKAKQLAYQANNLKDLVDKLEKQKELQQRQQAEKERLARQQAADKLRETNNYSYAQDDTAQGQNIKFSSAKGKLLRPARGPIVTKFRQEMSKGVASNGIDIKTAAKAQIIAPYDGTVIFAGPFKNFANLLIIDHGDGYTSLLSGLDNTDAKVGQLLMAGEPVGVMPANENSKLHMEIRKNNQPIDPVTWIAAQ